MMKVEISGLDALSRDLGNASNQAKAAGDAQAANAAEAIAQDMRDRVPVDRGNLRNSIRTEPARGGGTLIRAGGTPATMKDGGFDEAVAVEYGTTRSSAEPFFHNTLDDHRRGVERDVGEAADDAAGKAVR